MSKVTINIFPAKAGESFLINFDNKNILIDGGFADTFNDYIKPKLIELKNQEQCLDLVVVTHIDCDHILGVIELLKQNVNCTTSSIIKIDNIWFNSFYNLSNTYFTQDKLPEKIQRKIDRYKRISYKDPFSSVKEIGASESLSLTKRIGNGGYTHNFIDDKSDLIINGKNHIIGSASVEILSPNKSELKELENKFLNDLFQDTEKILSKDVTWDDVYEFILSKIIEEDEEPKTPKLISIEALKTIDELNKEALREQSDDVVNSSSIALIIEYSNIEEDRVVKMLFTGDCKSSIILKSLEEKYGKTDYYDFDLVKISHHGSKYSTSDNFFKKVRAQNYIVATNGYTYSHPSPEIIAKIICLPWYKKIILSEDTCSRKNKDYYKLFFGSKDNENYKYDIEIKNTIEI